MSFLERLAGFFGFGGNEGAGRLGVATNGAEAKEAEVATRTRLRRFEPILTDRPDGDGGIQGLDWYKNTLRMDEDGDVANEFIEVRSLLSQEGSTVTDNQSCPSLVFVKDGESIPVREELRNGVVYYSWMPKGLLH